MLTLAGRPGDAHLLSTCTPVFLQAPLLGATALTHRQLTPLVRLVSDRFFLAVAADGAIPAAAAVAVALASSRTRTGGYFLGGINHLLALSIAERAAASVEFVVTPNEPAVWDLLSSGDLDWACGVGAELLTLVEAGRVRVIASLDDRRRAPFESAPSLAEHGLPVSLTMWRGLIGPPGLSDDQQRSWHRLAWSVTETKAWRSYLERNGQTAAFLAGDAFAAFLEQEWDWYETHLRLANLLPGGS